LEQGELKKRKQESPLSAKPHGAKYMNQTGNSTTEGGTPWIVRRGEIGEGGESERI
jgi:hypothetical protein